MCLWFFRVGSVKCVLDATYSLLIRFFLMEINIFFFNRNFDRRSLYHGRLGNYKILWLTQWPRFPSCTSQSQAGAQLFSASMRSVLKTTRKKRQKIDLCFNNVPVWGMVTRPHTPNWARWFFLFFFCMIQLYVLSNYPSARIPVFFNVTHVMDLNVRLSAANFNVEQQASLWL